MSIFEVTPNSLKALERTDFASQGLRERVDLQPLIRDRIEVLDPDLMVISEEFSDWEESKRRIDLLAVDRQANLVVIELKRTESGGHMELQALRYAAMVSTMTFDRAVNIYRDFLQKMGRDDDPESSLIEFLEWDEPDEERFAQDVRMILASADFSKELTTAVMWLNQRDLDIRCIRLRPYSDGERVLLDVQQVIPLPEAEEFQVQVREKVQRERQTRSVGRARLLAGRTLQSNGTWKGRQGSRRAQTIAVLEGLGGKATYEEWMAAGGHRADIRILWRDGHVKVVEDQPNYQ